MDEQEIKQLKLRLDELEKMMKAMKGQGMSYYINIEHAEIQGPIVDKLDYNFDKLDVNEVSGALNLGNNFGVRVGKVSKKEDGSSASSKEKGRFVTRSTSQKKEKKEEENAQPNQSIHQQGQENVAHKDQKNHPPFNSNGERSSSEKGADSSNKGAGSGGQDMGHSQVEAKKLGNSKDPLSPERTKTQMKYVFGEENTLKPKFYSQSPVKQETIHQNQSAHMSSGKANLFPEKEQNRSRHEAVNLTTEHPQDEHGAPKHISDLDLKKVANPENDYDILATQKGFSFKKNDLI